MDSKIFEKLVGASLNLPNLPIIEEEEYLYTCPQCGELVKELIDTEGLLNGGIGKVCSQCYEDLGIGE